MESSNENKKLIFPNRNFSSLFRFIETIKQEGLKKMSRLYVQLSDNLSTAVDVSLRHGGKTCVIQLDTEKMVSDGIKFLVSRNGVWLVDYVDPKYFKHILDLGRSTN